MDWAIALVVITAIAALATVAVFALPYVRRRSDAEARLAALEAVNVALSDRLARAEQSLESVGAPRLPRLGVSR